MAAGLAIQDHTDPGRRARRHEAQPRNLDRFPGTCSPDTAGAPAEPCRPRPARGRPVAHSKTKPAGCRATVAPCRRREGGTWKLRANDLGLHDSQT